jgi:hypothetical protein
MTCNLYVKSKKRFRKPTGFGREPIDFTYILSKKMRFNSIDLSEIFME